MTTDENATLPARQMEPIRLDNLLINFTSEFHRIWNTSGPRIKQATFWRPAPAPDELPGYFPLGDVIVANGASIEGEMIAAVVREDVSPDIESTRGPALSRPRDYELIWKESGSGAVTHTSIWRPIPPAGYVAMGTVCSGDHVKPSLNAIRCVRADLTVAANVGGLVWDDKGSRATLNFSAWSIEPPTAGAGELCFTPGTFLGVQSHEKPTVAANAFRMQIPMQVSPPPEAPVLSGHEKPMDNGPAKVTQTARLPWFTVRDYAHPNGGFRKSPYYRLTRTDQYVLVGYGRNTTDKSTHIQWKVPRAQNATLMGFFNSNTAIEITGAWPALMLSDTRATKFSARLQKHFTHTETSSGEWHEFGRQIVIAMMGKQKSLAVYQLQSHYELLREDGTEVTVSFGYSDDTSFYVSEYPPADEVPAQPPQSAAVPSENTNAAGDDLKPPEESSNATDSAP